ncbi:N-succinylarginine dihydrolase [Nevskia soli]|uniref:N-succinylarginine dihydrolase n=1 Tax=Nevskia soli TaxID=418856 RepID=UPI000A0020F2|nr:N-succinylarginine dihydrolase [Nevskia soli]
MSIARGTVEANFDGLVGPTHNYAGLAMGNVASAKNAEQPSDPRGAVLQGLAKMKALADLGMAQGVLPPQERPHIPSLKRLGFSGRDADVLRKAHSEAPALLAAMASASSMWTANAATVSPSMDCADGRVHFTPANLATHLHRAIEPETTARALRAIFTDDKRFVHHEALPATPQMGDEGAANHTRLCSDYGAPGLELFVYGAAGDDSPRPQKYPARQTLAASEAVARLHQLDPSRRYFAQQKPEVIDQGVFHNDVIAVGNREVLLYHEQAFTDKKAIQDWVRRCLRGSSVSAREPVLLEIKDSEVPVEDAVHSYLFNSQLICPPDGSMWIVAAHECEERPRVWAAIQRLVEDPANPIAGVKVFDLRQSMRNGGGPACLRLRVVLAEAERAAVNPKIWMNDALYTRLTAWANKYYRDRLVLADLADPTLLDESRGALDELTQILGLGSLYDFQR